MSGTRRKHAPEFREQAARLVIETRRPAARVAAKIDVGSSGYLLVAGRFRLEGYGGRRGT
jgi:transposase-like protein